MRFEFILLIVYINIYICRKSDGEFRDAVPLARWHTLRTNVPFCSVDFSPSLPFCFILAVSLSLILSLIVHAEQHCDCLYKRAFFSGLPFEIFYKHTQSSFSFTMFFRFFINNNCEQSFNPPKNKIKKLTKPINTIIAAIRYSLRGQCTTSSLIHCFIGLFNFSWEYFETAAWNIQSIILTDEWHDRFADWIFVFFVSLKPSQFWISIEPFFWYIEGLLSNNFQK